MRGVTIAADDRAQNPNLTLTDALLGALDCSDQTGLAGPIIENLRSALLTGSHFTPPPDDCVRLTIIRSDGARGEWPYRALSAAGRRCRRRLDAAIDAVEG